MCLGAKTFLSHFDVKLVEIPGVPCCHLSDSGDYDVTCRAVSPPLLTTGAGLPSPMSVSAVRLRLPSQGEITPIVVKRPVSKQLRT